MPRADVGAGGQQLHHAFQLQQALGKWELRVQSTEGKIKVPRGLSEGLEIASDGVFAAAMLAEMRPSLENLGAWFYRALFWETGLIGQMLYLEAEAAGIRGTGMGCFFDDAMHRLLGMTEQRWQSLYHFTVGGGGDDPRLVSLPAYHHLG
jgi:hypothetical protein